MKKLYRKLGKSEKKRIERRGYRDECNEVLSLHMIDIIGEEKGKWIEACSHQQEKNGMSEYEIFVRKFLCKI